MRADRHPIDGRGKEEGFNLLPGIALLRAVWLMVTEQDRCSTEQKWHRHPEVAARTVDLASWETWQQTQAGENNALEEPIPRRPDLSFFYFQSQESG